MKIKLNKIGSNMKLTTMSIKKTRKKYTEGVTMGSGRVKIPKSFLDREEIANTFNIYKMNL